MDRLDRSNLVEDLRWQVEAVRAALAPVGCDEIPVTGVVCFTGARWGWFATPIRVGETLVTWPDQLLAEIARATPLERTDIELVARQLDHGLPANR